MKKFHKLVKGIWYYIWGHLFSLFYDRKYIRGKWFNGKMNGLCAPGWQWVTHDALAKIFTGNNTDARFPVGRDCRVIYPDNIHFDPDDLNNFQSFGIYYQAIGNIFIGKGTYLGPNVGLITANHDVYNPDEHLPPKDIVIGEKCWVGMNSVILPGTVLGNHTVVGAGSIVTKSFPEGNCVLAGNPAKKLKDL